MMEMSEKEALVRIGNLTIGDKFRLTGFGQTEGKYPLEIVGEFLSSYPVSQRKMVYRRVGGTECGAIKVMEGVIIPVGDKP